MDVVAGARQDAHLQAAREAVKAELAKRAAPEPGPAAMEAHAQMTAAELGDLGGGRLLLALYPARGNLAWRSSLYRASGGNCCPGNQGGIWG